MTSYETFKAALSKKGIYISPLLAAPVALPGGHTFGLYRIEGRASPLAGMAIGIIHLEEGCFDILLPDTQNSIDGAVAQITGERN